MTRTITIGGATWDGGCSDSRGVVSDWLRDRGHDVLADRLQADDWNFQSADPSDAIPMYSVVLRPNRNTESGKEDCAGASCDWFDTRDGALTRARELALTLPDCGSIVVWDRCDEVETDDITRFGEGVEILAMVDSYGPGRIQATGADILPAGTPCERY